MIAFKKKKKKKIKIEGGENVNGREKYQSVSWAGKYAVYSRKRDDETRINKEAYI